MKKIFALIAVATAALFTANAQSIRNFNAEDYAKEQYGTKWTQTAMRVADEQELDQDGSLTYTKTIMAPGMSQQDLYYEVAEWFIDNYQNSIQMADKEDGIIVARPYVSEMATAAFGWNEYKIDICPTVRVKVTDGQATITYTLKDYGVVEHTGAGNVSTAVACGLLAGAIIADATSPTTTVTTTHHHHGHGYGHHHHHHHVVKHVYRSHAAVDDLLVTCALVDLATGSRYDQSRTVWPVSHCYPYASKDSHKKASAKAFVVATTYSQMVMDDIEYAINQSLVAYRD